MERIFWGLFLIVAAVVLVVGQLGFLQGVGLFSILLTIVLAACLINSIIHFSMTGILFSIAFLCIVYAKPLGITAITPWTVLGAALLGSIGFSIIFHKKKDYHKYYKKYDNHDNEGFETVETCVNNCEKLSTSFGSSIKYIKSDDFQKADIDCRFGGMKIYFDSAVIKQDVAEIDLDVSFGGVELFIPKEWQIENNVSASCAGIDEKNHNNSTGSPVLRLNGKISFSGITIIYV